MGSFTAILGGGYLLSLHLHPSSFMRFVGECNLGQFNEDMRTFIHISAEQHSGKGRTRFFIQSVGTGYRRHCCCCDDQQLCFSLAGEKKTH